MNLNIKDKYNCDECGFKCRLKINFLNHKCIFRYKRSRRTDSRLGGDFVIPSIKSIYSHKTLQVRREPRHT